MLSAFISRYRHTLIAVAAALAIFAGGYGLGTYQTEMRHAEKAIATAQKAASNAKSETVAVIDAGNKATAERIEVKVRDLARERALETSLSKMRTERDELQKALNETPDYAADCRLRIGDVRLLNYAARPADFDADPGASDPADFAAYQEQAPSTVSCRAFVSGEVDIRFQYNELAQKHDALVDWIEREVIAPQLPVDSAETIQ